MYVSMQNQQKLALIITKFSLLIIHYFESIISGDDDQDHTDVSDDEAFSSEQQVR